MEEKRGCHSARRQIGTLTFDGTVATLDWYFARRDRRSSSRRSPARVLFHVQGSTSCCMDGCAHCRLTWERRPIASRHRQCAQPSMQHPSFCPRRCGSSMLGFLVGAEVALAVPNAVCAYREYNTSGDHDTARERKDTQGNSSAQGRSRRATSRHSRGASGFVGGDLTSANTRAAFSISRVLASIS